MKHRRLVGGLAAFATVLGGLALATPAQAGSVTGPAFAVIAKGDSPRVVVTHRGTDGRVHVLESKGAPLARPSAVSRHANPATVAKAHLDRYAKAFGAEPADLEPAGTTSVAGGHAVRFDQVVDGIPVLGGQLVTSLDADGDLEAILGEAAPQPEQRFPLLSRLALGKLELVAERAVQRRERLGSDAELTVSSEGRAWYDAELVGAKDPAQEHVEPVYRFEVSGADGLRDMVLVNARTHKTELAWSLNQDAINRVVCDAKKKVVDDSDPAAYTCGKKGQAFKPARVEDGPKSKVADVNKVYKNFYRTALAYAAYDNVDLTALIGSNYHDGLGKALRATVRICTATDCPYPNAFWDGEQMAFGQGVSTLDVTAHELTHGVTQETSGLQYLFQAGAINESFSDWMGEIVDIRRGESAKNRWKIGNGSAIGVIRDMANPPAFGQPDTMTSDLWYPGVDDNGGVHENSGVGNKLAFLIADGQQFNGYDISGIGIAKLAKILWTTQNLFPSAGDYKDLFYTVPLACRKNIGRPGTYITEQDCQQVDKAVRATELYRDPAQGAPRNVAYCDDGGSVDQVAYHAGFENHSGWTFEGNWFLSSEVAFGAYAPVGEDAAVAWTLAGDDISLTQNLPVMVPEGAFLRFDHSYLFDTGDGGELEYSTDAGVTWKNASDLPNVNGEDTPLDILGGDDGWTGVSYGYGGSRYDLSSLAGQLVKFRFHTAVATDNSAWWVDNLKIYTCG